MKVVEHWHRLLSEVMVSPALEIFRTQLDIALGNKLHVALNRGLCQPQPFCDPMKWSQSSVCAPYAMETGESPFPQVRRAQHPWECLPRGLILLHLCKAEAQTHLLAACIMVSSAVVLTKGKGEENVASHPSCVLNAGACSRMHWEMHQQWHSFTPSYSIAMLPFTSSSETQTV